MTRITDDWVHASAPQAVMHALGGQAFFVGGCVRNALMGRAISDIDIATPLVPHDVEQRLHGAGIKTVPTGLQHGTQTAVVDGEGIEVTTFRADIATDGRHAEVAFTEDMAIDAARRDFTMNALYARADGTVIDPLGGLPDLHAQRVRFIGQAEDRIREDYLRILRFFRFHAWYGADGVDADGLAACAALADGLDGLARERVGWEFRKLFSSLDPAPSVASMAQAGILVRCLPGADHTFLAPLVHLEAKAGFPPAWQTRLAALGGGDQAGHLRLSRAEAAALDRINAALADPGTV
ncbi:MAG: CCA tRNA nucleotidyltransferase, partial [Pseudomonadota bacterium]